MRETNSYREVKKNEKSKHSKICYAWGICEITGARPLVPKAQSSLATWPGKARSRVWVASEQPVQCNIEVMTFGKESIKWGNFVVNFRWSTLRIIRYKSNKNVNRKPLKNELDYLNAKYLTSRHTIHFKINILIKLYNSLFLYYFQWEKMPWTHYRK